MENPSSYEVTTMYYNAYGEMIQQRSTNHLSGNDDNFRHNGVRNDVHL